MQKEKIKKIAYKSLIVATIFFAVGAFLFVSKNVEAKSSVTKWQVMLQKAGIDQSFWQACLPSVSRSEYNRVKKLWAASGSTAAASAPAATAATAQPVAATTGSLGPEIAVGIRYFSKSDTFKIDANKTYNIKDGDGNILFSSSRGLIPRPKVEYDAMAII